MHMVTSYVKQFWSVCIQYVHTEIETSIVSSLVHLSTMMVGEVEP